MKTDQPDAKVEDRGEASRQGPKQGEHDCPSENELLEYEEDVYYSYVTATPSFDDIDELSDDAEEIIVHCWRDSNGDVDEIVVDDANFSVETQFLPETEEGAAAGGSRKKKSSVRVIFQDFSKPYLAKISSSQNYKKFLELVKGADIKLASVTRETFMEPCISFIFGYLLSFYIRQKMKINLSVQFCYM